MTDHVNMLYVILEKDVNINNIKGLQKAISHMRGVLEVKTHIASVDDAVAESRARIDMTKKVLEVINPPTDK